MWSTKALTAALLLLSLLACQVQARELSEPGESRPSDLCALGSAVPAAHLHSGSSEVCKVCKGWSAAIKIGYVDCS